MFSTPFNALGAALIQCLKRLSGLCGFVPPLGSISDSSSNSTCCHSVCFFYSVQIMLVKVYTNVGCYDTWCLVSYVSIWYNPTPHEMQSQHPAIISSSVCTGQKQSSNVMLEKETGQHRLASQL